MGQPIREVLAYRRMLEVRRAANVSYGSFPDLCECPLTGSTRAQSKPLRAKFPAMVEESFGGCVSGWAVGVVARAILQPLRTSRFRGSVRSSLANGHETQVAALHQRESGLLH